MLYCHRFGIHGPHEAFGTHGPPEAFGTHGVLEAFGTHGRPKAFGTHGPPKAFGAHGPLDAFGTHGEPWVPKPRGDHGCQIYDSTTLNTSVTHFRFGFGYMHKLG